MLEGFSVRKTEYRCKSTKKSLFQQQTKAKIRRNFEQISSINPINAFKWK